MIIPSIDLRSGNAVQLERGRELKIDAGDPRPLATSFGRTGEIAVIDLDAAIGTGTNEDTIRDLLPLAPCRVGGGIRDVDTAVKWLDAGARKVILGTAATPEILSQLPRDRVIAALDAEHGEVVTHGWRTKSGAKLSDKVAELAPHVGGFLVTFVEVEGTMTGTDLARAQELKQLAGNRQLTVAGGVKSTDEIARLDAMGIDAQIGMALYTKTFTVADALAEILNTARPDTTTPGLWPTVVADAQGVTLGLAYSNAESLSAALGEGRGIYHSRRRGLWRKGETSGSPQRLISVHLDCDRDALLFVVDQDGSGFCHLNTWTCFGADPAVGVSLGSLARRLSNPETRAAPGSYTARLFTEEGLLESKLAEEARELNEAGSTAETIHEAADVLYFTLVTLAKRGVSLADVQRELERRSFKVTRRRGDRKD